MSGPLIPIYGTEFMSLSQMPTKGAPSILALHGSASSGGIWQPLAKALEGERVVLAPDLPGYGKNASMSEYDAETRFAWLGEALCSIGGQFDLIGHSFGGAVAMTLANQFPERINSIILYEPIVPPGKTIKDAPEIQDLWSLWTSMLRLDINDAMARFCHFWSGPNSWEQMGERARERLTSVYASVMLDFRQVFTGQLDVARAEFQSPLTVLRGDTSPPVAAAMSQRLLDQNPVAHMHVLRGLGHLGPVTHADQVVQSIRHALAGSKAPRSRPIDSSQHASAQERAL